MSGVSAGSATGPTLVFGAAGQVGEELLALAAARGVPARRRPPVDAITTADYPTPARRPANSQLDSSRFAARFGTRAAPWQQRTDEVVAMLVAPAD